MSDYYNGTISPREDVVSIENGEKVTLLRQGSEYRFSYSPDPPGFSIQPDNASIPPIVFFSAHMFDPIDLAIYECTECGAKCFHHEKHSIPNGDGSRSHTCPDCLKGESFYVLGHIHGHEEGRRK